MHCHQIDLLYILLFQWNTNVKSTHHFYDLLLEYNCPIVDIDDMLTFINFKPNFESKIGINVYSILSNFHHSKLYLQNNHLKWSLRFKSFIFIIFSALNDKVSLFKKILEFYTKTNIHSSPFLLDSPAI